VSALSPETDPVRDGAAPHAGAHHTAPPSPWPFFIPVGMAVSLLGLGLLSMALVLAGIVMMGPALIGWFRDAGHDWRLTDDAAVGREQSRDAPGGLLHRSAMGGFPRWLVAVDGVIVLMALAITVGGWSVDARAAFVRGQSQATPPPGGGSGGLALVAQNIRFSSDSLAAPAGKPFDIAFQNDDKVPHNVAIFTSATDQKALFQGTIVTGPISVTYHVPALTAGTYAFRCEVHPASMTGTLTVR
jgi:plastocyanin